MGVPDIIYQTVGLNSPQKCGCKFAETWKLRATNGSYRPKHNGVKGVKREPALPVPAPPPYCIVYCDINPLLTDAAD